MTELICCQQLAGAGQSPFDVTALGYYDGPTDGFASCQVCGRTYHFALIAWDDGQDVRIYGFAAVPSEVDPGLRTKNRVC